MRVKRLLAGLSGLIVLLLLAACGTNNNTLSSSNTPATTATSGITTRAFVSNQQAGVLQIVNFAIDTITSSTISVGSPSQMWVSADHSETVVFSTSSFAVSVVKNSTEQVVGTIPLCSACSLDNPASNGIVVSSDGTIGWAAIRQLGAVVQLDLVNFKILNTIPVLNARHLALSSDDKTLLVFGDETSSSTQVTVITGANTSSPVIQSTVPGLDQPVAAYFNSDNSTAFILNCGLNCNTSHTGQPSVAAFTVATNAVSTLANVTAANLALLNSDTLWVAGAQPVSGQSTVLTPVDVSTGTPGSPIPLTGQDSQGNTISIGTPNRMALDGTSLAIGSGCANVEEFD